MKNVIGLIFVVHLASCGEMRDAAEHCHTPIAAARNFAACSGRTIQISGILVSTRHGDYLSETADSKPALVVTYSESEIHAATVTALMDEIDKAAVGKATTAIAGDFEGKLISRSQGRVPVFEIQARVSKSSRPR